MRSTITSSKMTLEDASPLVPKGRGETAKPDPRPRSSSSKPDPRPRLASSRERLGVSALPPRGPKVVAAATPAEATIAPCESQDLDLTYHDGELQVQKRMGVADTAQFRSAHQKTFLPVPAQDFFAKRPFVVISAHDAEGRMFCSMVATADGSPCLEDITAHTLVLRASSLSPMDALRGALVPGTAVGLIGIDFSTRARVRVNTSVQSIRKNGDVILGVELSASHFAQYIAQCTWEASPNDEAPSEAKDAAEVKGFSSSAGAAPSPALGSPASLEDPSIIAGADTFFIGSSYGRREGDGDARHGADASNRCGSPGLVRVTGAQTIVFDNYNGNQMYSTLGNITKDPRVGLTFFDWESGEALQISGIAEIDFTPPEVSSPRLTLSLLLH